MAKAANLVTLKKRLLFSNLLEYRTPKAANESNSTRLLYINMDPKLPKLEVIRSLQYCLPFNTLFHTDIISEPTVLFKILRDYMLL